MTQPNETTTTDTLAAAVDALADVARTQAKTIDQMTAPPPPRPDHLSPILQSLAPLAASYFQQTMTPPRPIPPPAGPRERQVRAEYEAEHRRLESEYAEKHARLVADFGPRFEKAQAADQQASADALGMIMKHAEHPNGAQAH
jgi:hypothetical protein